MDSEWQDAPISVRNAHILKTGLRSDCCFLVGVVAENQRLFQTHKFVLSSASPVFERMFYGSIPEKGIPIEVYDIDADDFFNVLQFIYTGETVIPSVERAQQVYYAATKYMLKELTKTCMTFLKNNLNSQNVCQIYEFSQQFEEKSLEEQCMDFIKINTSDVLKSPCFVLANISTLDAILNQGTLKISSEQEIFRALERYGDFRFSIDKRRNSSCEFCSSGIPKLRKNSIKETDETVVGDKEDDPQKSEHGNSPAFQNLDALSQNRVEGAPPVAVKEVENAEKPKGKMLYVDREQTENAEKFYKLLKKVRYLTMGAKTFASGPALSKYLSISDALAILVCIDEPLNVPTYFPQGFTDSKLNRF